MHWPNKLVFTRNHSSHVWLSVAESLINSRFKMNSFRFSQNGYKVYLTQFSPAVHSSLSLCPQACQPMIMRGLPQCETISAQTLFSRRKEGMESIPSISISPFQRHPPSSKIWTSTSWSKMMSQDQSQLCDSIQNLQPSLVGGQQGRNRMTTE